MKHLFIIILSFMINIGVAQSDFKQFVLGPDDDGTTYNNLYSINLCVDFAYRDFQEFEPIIGSYNVQAIYPVSATLVTEIAFTFDHLYSFIGYGRSNGGFYKNDSLNIQLKEVQYSTGFGIEYFFKNIHILSQVGIKWQRSRLLNESKNYAITAYNLDLKFNQIYAIQGVRLGYRFYTKDILFTEYLTFGFYYNYIIKINKYPFARLNGERVFYEQEIQINNINWGIYFAFATGF